MRWFSSSDLASALHALERLRYVVELVGVGAFEARALAEIDHGLLRTSKLQIAQPSKIEHARVFRSAVATEVNCSWALA